LSGHHFAAVEATTAVPRLVASCHGTVLELGAATGNQLPRFTKSALKRVYGIEPNSGFMDVLSARALETGLQDIYTPINCGIEHVDILEGHGIREETMDCILSIQVLCSVGDPAEAAAFSYRLLKPGGEFIFFEHHASHDWFSSKVQSMFSARNIRDLLKFVLECWDFVWPFSIGGCHMHRPIKDILLESGSWEMIELTDNEEPWMLFPRVWGKLRKV